MNCPHCKLSIDDCVCSFDYFAHDGYYDKTRIVGLEKGEWSDDKQDWRGILVFDSGLRIQTKVFLKDLVRRFRRERSIAIKAATNQ